VTEGERELNVTRELRLSEGEGERRSNEEKRRGEERERRMCWIDGNCLFVESPTRVSSSEKLHKIERNVVGDLETRSEVSTTFSSPLRAILSSSAPSFALVPPEAPKQVVD
jgi:hypothetical protein